MASLAHGQGKGQFLTVEGGRVREHCLNHIVGVADGRDLRVYLNGKQVGNMPYDGTIADTGSMRLGIGDSSVMPAPGSAFKGYIDEISIFDRALSDQEIRHRYSAEQRAEGIKYSKAHAKEMRRLQLVGGLTRDESLIDKLIAQGVEQVVLASRGPGRDVQAHYYANFANTSDRDYHAMLAHLQAAADRLRHIKRFDMPEFRPGPEYLREMRRYGILGHESTDDGAPVDPYETDQRYWEMMYTGSDN